MVPFRLWHQSSPSRWSPFVSTQGYGVALAALGRTRRVNHAGVSGRRCPLRAVSARSAGPVEGARTVCPRGRSARRVLSQAGDALPVSIGQHNQWRHFRSALLITTRNDQGLVELFDPPVDRVGGCLGQTNSTGVDIGSRGRHRSPLSPALRPDSLAVLDDAGHWLPMNCPTCCALSPRNGSPA